MERIITATFLLVFVAHLCSADSKAAPGKIPPVIDPVRCPGGSKWSNWIDRDLPSATSPVGPSAEGEHELLTHEEKTQFCPHGNITKIECDHFSTPAGATGNGVTCNVWTGLSCDNGANTPHGCFDFKARYFCQCPDIISPATVTDGPGSSSGGTGGPSIATVESSIGTSGSLPASSGLLGAGGPSSGIGSLLPTSVSSGSSLGTRGSTSGSAGRSSDRSKVSTDSMFFENFKWLIVAVSCAILFLCNCLLTIFLYISTRKMIKASEHKRRSKVHPLNEV